MSILITPEQPYRSGNQYLIDVINARKATPISLQDKRIKTLLSTIDVWAGKQLADKFISGSTAKGTSILGCSDLDLFISLKADTNLTLKQIFNSLHDTLKKEFSVRKQNVSIRVVHNKLQIDIVPGKKMPYQTHWHFLYTNRRQDQERIQTNVNNHVNMVINSGRINEIIALKVWRKINKLDFPSMYLERYAIDALHGKWSGKTHLTDNFLYVLTHIAKYFSTTAVYDPSNSNNVISHSLYKYEKEEIQNAAIKSLKNDYLSHIIY